MPNILKNIADNPELLKAVKETVLKHFEDADISSSMTDEQIGQITRARVSGIEKVEDAFREIEAFKSAPTPTPKDNPAY